MTTPIRPETPARDIEALHREAERLIDDAIDLLLTELDGNSPLLARMGAYHLGMLDADGNSMPLNERRQVQGKRMRPLLALLSCAAAGGPMRAAAPLAAAIELLHNFTLVHDDIQDRSPNRRHRPTVWRLWGDAQAINAGDALFAAAQIGVLDSDASSAAPTRLLEIARAFNRMTIDIVRGQVLDLEFEGRHDVTPDDYLAMIGGKTAAIVRFAAWAGARLGGADGIVASHFAAFGSALGIGFQLRDDALGVWGTAAQTGKDTADDIRRRKQSLPVLLLRAAASPADRVELDRIFGGDCVAETDVERVLAMLDRYAIAVEVSMRVRAAHDAALTELAAVPANTHPTAIAALRALTDRMAARAS